MRFESTPSIIKQLIIAICAISLISATSQLIFDRLGWTPGPQQLLSLSWWGIAQGFIWQPITYMFINEFQASLSLSYLISLMFNMYILWVVGTSVLEIVGRKAFINLYLFSGVISAQVALLFILVTDQSVYLAGTTTPLLTLLVIWGLTFPDADILLFFILPVKTKWLILGALGFLLLSTLSEWNLPGVALYLSSIFIGYGYGTCFLGLHSPFECTQKFDSWLAAKSFMIQRHLPRWFSFSGSVTPNKGSKIIDLGTKQQHLDDEQFVDDMLTKIAKDGEESLTWNEKRRLQKISERKGRDS